MSEIRTIEIAQLCKHYEVEISFFTGLSDIGLIEVITVEERPCIAEERIAEVEKMLRLHRDLDINFEGIDTIFNLLNRIDSLQNELDSVKSRLRLFEGG
jgi:hypothetical protein